MAASVRYTAEQLERRTYWKSLLNLKLPVSVTLARKTMPAARVLELAAGSMIQFDVPCDTPLQLEIDEKTIALGDVVKVGDKFGIKLHVVEQHSERWIDVADRVRELTRASVETSADAKEKTATSDRS